MLSKLYSSRFLEENGQSTVGGPKWTKMDLFRPKWTQNGPFWSRECQNPVRNKLILAKMVVWTILDHFGPVHIPTVRRPLPILEEKFLVRGVFPNSGPIVHERLSFPEDAQTLAGIIRIALIFFSLAFLVNYQKKRICRPRRTQKILAKNGKRSTQQGISCKRKSNEDISEANN